MKCDGYVGLTVNGRAVGVMKRCTFYVYRDNEGGGVILNGDVEFVMPYYGIGQLVVMNDEGETIWRSVPQSLLKGSPLKLGMVQARA